MNGRFARVLAACLSLGLVGLGIARAGEWERDRAVARERAGLVSVRQLVGPLGGRHLTGSRQSPSPGSNVQSLPLTCFLYQRGPAPSAYELCWDSSGGLVEALDRSRGESRLKIWSLRWAPRSAPIHLPAAVLQRLTAQAGRRAQQSTDINDAFHAVEQRLGRLDGPELVSHNSSAGLSCFVYGTPATELCWDRLGRLLEATQQVGGRRHTWSLRRSPWDAQVVEPRGDLDRLAERVSMRG